MRLHSRYFPPLAMIALYNPGLLDAFTHAIRVICAGWKSVRLPEESLGRHR